MPEPKHTSKEVQPMQSTLGPWKFYEDENYIPPAPELVGMPGRGDKDRRFLIDGAAPGKESFIGEVISCYGEGDARLIAAAPELRDALADLVVMCEQTATEDTHTWRGAKALLTRLRKAGV